MVTRGRLHNPCGGDLSLDFVNSIGRSSTGVQNERLVDYPALLRWCGEAGALPESTMEALRLAAEGQERAAKDVVARARALREALFEIWHEHVHGLPAPPEPLALLNAEAARALQHARIETTEQGFGWTWECGSRALDAPLWPIARAAAELLVSADRKLVGECAGDTCLWLFVDRTRNHGRRWCEMKSCGNREKVRNHRRRRRI